MWCRSVDVQLERRNHDERFDVDGNDLVPVGVLHHDPGCAGRCRGEEPVGLSLGDRHVVVTRTAAASIDDLLRVGELRRIRHAVADRLAEEDELAGHLVVEIGVGRETILIPQLVDVPDEAALSEVLDRRHTDGARPLLEDLLLLVTLELIAVHLALVTPGCPDQGDTEQQRGLENLHLNSPGSESRLHLLLAENV